MNKKEGNINIAMVGYHNTLPFLFGLENHRSSFNLDLDIPSKCMDYYTSGHCDIALVPIASLIGRDDYKIITDYCIGCIGAVETVCVFSDVPISNVTHMILDADSRTSQLLTKILCLEHWNIAPLYSEASYSNQSKSVVSTAAKEGNTKQYGEDIAYLLIGDKAFDQEQNFKYKYDLGQEWKSMTGLSFAFAVWIARPKTSGAIIDKLNLALREGVENLDAVVKRYSKMHTELDLLTYYEKFIDYAYDKEKKIATNLYFSLGETVRNQKLEMEMNSFSS